MILLPKTGMDFFLNSTCTKSYKINEQDVLNLGTIRSLSDLTYRCRLRTVTIIYVSIYVSFLSLFTFAAPSIDGIKYL